MLVRHISVRILTAVLAIDLFAIPAFVHAAGVPSAVQPGALQVIPGTILSDDTLVRSGSDATKYYATNRLAKGDHVQVTGPAAGDWLPIVPPSGSFCYVAKSYVTKNVNADTAVVSQADIRIRAGSLLVDKKLTVLPMANPINVGDTLLIVGEEKEYFKIVPPAGVQFWVEKSAVDLTPPAPTPVPAPIVATATQTPVVPAPVATPIVPTPVAPAPVASAPVAPAPFTPAPVASSNTALTTLTPSPTPASTQPAEGAVAVTPTTGPVEPTLSAQERFDSAEAAFAAAIKLPLDQQPIDSLTTQYTALSADSTLPVRDQQFVTTRLATLKLRGDAQQQFADAMKIQKEAVERRQAQKAEQEELAAKIKEDAITVYAAVGTLRTTSLAQSGTTLYRICDPSSGRTMLYVRTNDPKYAGLLNKFIGVKGTVIHDDQMNLKVITPTGGESVDQAKVGTTITATMLPPSMVTKTVTASTGNQ